MAMVHFDCSHNSIEDSELRLARGLGFKIDIHGYSRLFEFYLWPFKTYFLLKPKYKMASSLFSFPRKMDSWIKIFEIHIMKKTLTLPLS